MARGRFISNKISKSARVNKLGFAPALLYTLMITHLDCEGRMHGDPRIVKNTVFPLRDNVTVKQVDQWLKDMADMKKNGQGLIVRYEVDHETYIWFPGFEGEQVNLRKDREAPSVIPPPPGLPPPVEKPEPEAVNGTGDTILDPNFAAIVNAFHSEIGMISSTIKDKLEAICGEYPVEVVTDAISEAARQNHRSLAYVEGILKRWKVDGKGSKKAPGKKEDDYEVKE